MPTSSTVNTTTVSTGISLTTSPFLSSESEFAAAAATVPGQTTGIISNLEINMLAATVSPQTTGGAATVEDVINVNNLSSSTSQLTSSNCSSTSTSTVAVAAIATSQVTPVQSQSTTNITSSTIPTSIDTIDANPCNNIITTPTICIGVGQTTTTDDIITSIAATSILNGTVGCNSSLLDSTEIKSHLQHSPIDQSTKVGDLNLSTSPNGGLGNILLSPVSSGGGFIPSHSDHGLSIGGNGTSTNPASALWSTADDGNHMPMNGYNNFQNFSTPPLFNGAAAVAASLAHQQRRAITAASQSQNYHHGLSPNRSAQLLQGQHGGATQQNQQQSHQPNIFKNPYPAWSTSAAAAAVAAQSSAWPPSQQQQQNQSQSNLAQWNRGRSVPNLNPLTSGGGGLGGIPQRKPTSPNPPGPSPSGFSSQSGIPGISPLKYRRSTSFPGKGPSPASIGGYSLDVPTIDDSRDPFLAYQVVSTYKILWF